VRGNLCRTTSVSDVAVRCVGLGKSYQLHASAFSRLKALLAPGSGGGREFWAVRDLDLEVPRGSVFGLVGRNGAGKSTTLKMIAGRLRPTTGRVEVKGHVSSILELGTGLNPNLTGRQNARVNALFLGLDPWQIESQLERVLEFAELGQYVDEPLSHYSSGMRARLAFAVLTAVVPEVLILDEALSAGDTAFARKCQEFVRRLCGSGCTAIVVSHDLAFLEQSCDTVAWIDKGSVVRVGSPTRTIEEYVVSTVRATPAAEYRPRRLVLRFMARTDVVAELDYAQLRAGAQAVSGLSLGREDAWQSELELAAEVGLSHEGARRGWGAVVPKEAGRPLRRLTLAPGQAAHLVVPVAPAPDPAPTVVRLVGTTSAPLEVTLVHDGEQRSLGAFAPDPTGIVDLQLEPLSGARGA
jgi:ABC-type polysaccharide/polyol phosphate transport system ATPase subunit